MQLLSLDYDGKLLSLVLIGLQLVSIYFGPESVSDQKKDHYQVISDRIFGPEFVSDQNLFRTGIIIQFISRLESSGDSDRNIFWNGKRVYFETSGSKLSYISKLSDCSISMNIWE